MPGDDCDSCHRAKGLCRLSLKTCQRYGRDIVVFLWSQKLHDQNFHPRSYWSLNSSVVVVVPEIRGHYDSLIPDVFVVPEIRGKESPP